MIVGFGIEPMFHHDKTIRGSMRVGQLRSLRGRYHFSRIVALEPRLSGCLSTLWGCNICFNGVDCDFDLMKIRGTYAIGSFDLILLMKGFSAISSRIYWRFVEESCA